MSTSLGAVLPHLSRAAIVSLLGLSSQPGDRQCRNVRIRDLAAECSLHPQSVWKGLAELEAAGLVSRISQKRLRKVTFLLFPGIPGALVLPLECSLSLSTGARVVLPNVSPVKAATVSPAGPSSRSKRGRNAAPAS